VTAPAELLWAVDRIAGGTGGSRHARARFQAALERGAGAPEALKAAGAPREVVRLVREASPGELPAVLRDLGVALELAQARRAALAGASLYPLLLAGVAVLLGWFLLRVVDPALATVGTDALNLPQPVSTAPALLALAVSVPLLLLLGLSLRARAPQFPFSRAREGHDRALVVAGAAALARQGCSLVVALRAAAHLSTTDELRAASWALADRLERGQTGAAEGEASLLLGPLGTALFLSAAAGGAGGASLTALSELHEATAAGELPGLLVRAELFALLLGGASILAVGAALFHTYSAALGRP
jgi:hypothetical protein